MQLCIAVEHTGVQKSWKYEVKRHIQILKENYHGVYDILYVTAILFGHLNEW